VLVACCDGRAQLGQLRVYSETDRSKLSAADVHVVVVIVAAFVRLIVRVIFGVGTCSCSSMDVILDQVELFLVLWTRAGADHPRTKGPHMVVKGPIWA